MGKVEKLYIHDESVHNHRAASVIVPIIQKLIRPESVLDVGCGIGTWLKVFKEVGVKNVFGVDGDYVDRTLLKKFISENNFKAVDLRLPLVLNTKFDLTICLEVAEHLPYQTADCLIESLCRHSETILFSAAIPFQGGQNHLNEQVPQYWIDKFKFHGYKVYDPIRSEVWECKEVDVWYKQNIFLFSRKKLDLPIPIFTHLVHPDLFEVHQIKKIQFQNELKKLRNGQANPLFYLKNFFKSLIVK